MPNHPPNLKWRPAEFADRPFMASSWFESYRKGGHSPEVDFGIYKAGQGRRIDTLLSTRLCVVAYLPEEGTEILGWLCREVKQPTMHYVYVKQAYRRNGVATFLLEALGRPTDYTHQTRAAKFLKPAMQFNPYHLETICN